MTTALSVIRKSLNNNYDVKFVDYYKDIKYSVDFEIYKNNKLCVAIQLKSTYYKKSKRDILRSTKKMNLKKNKDYERLFNIPVLTLYINKHKYIENLSDINKFLKYKIILKI